MPFIEMQTVEASVCTTFVACTFVRTVHPLNNCVHFWEGGSMLGGRGLFCIVFVCSAPVTECACAKPIKEAKSTTAQFIRGLAVKAHGTASGRALCRQD